eukprot:GHVU01138640.1.p1 GENE.GHVU01138640.1~~GHVU01138640.1.p1  ORF type:complete len:109 (-),score=20.54 GHVU01138640.1:82-408(-)
MDSSQTRWGDEDSANQPLLASDLPPCFRRSSGSDPDEDVSEGGNEWSLTPPSQILLRRILDPDDDDHHHHHSSFIDSRSSVNQPTLLETGVFRITRHWGFNDRCCSCC